MSNELLTEFPETDRRIYGLRQELYTYDKWLRDPAGAKDMPAQAAMALNADQQQRELSELVYLRSLPDKLNQPTGIRTWQAALLIFFIGIALTIAAISLWLTLVVH